MLLLGTTLRDVAEVWRDAQQLHGEAPGFPDTVREEGACYRGECRYSVSPERLEHLKRHVRLILQHYTPADHKPLALTFEANLDHRLLREIPSLRGIKRHVLVGDFMRSYHLQCEFFLLHPENEGDCMYVHTASKLTLARETVLDQAHAVWPQIRSETCFLIDLAKLDVGQWDVSVLNVDFVQAHVLQVYSKSTIGFRELEALEVERLRQAHALRLSKRLSDNGKRRARSKNKRQGKGKGKGKGRCTKGRGRGRGKEPVLDSEDGHFSDYDDRTDSDLSDDPGFVLDGDAVFEKEEEAIVGHDGACKGGGADEKEKRRSHASVPWGNGVWALAEIMNKEKELIGVGAHCKCHETPGVDAICKKQVTIGNSGLSVQTFRLRMKRWLVAGLDDGDWDTDDPRQYHIDMGKAHYLADFAHGLPEEELDEIANSSIKK